MATSSPQDLDGHAGKLLDEIRGKPNRYPAFSRILNAKQELEKFRSGQNAKQVSAQTRRKFLMLLAMPFVSFGASKALDSLERRRKIPRPPKDSSTAFSGLATGISQISTAYLSEDLLRDAVEKAEVPLAWLPKQVMFQKLPSQVQEALTIAPEALIAPAHQAKRVGENARKPGTATARALARSALKTALLQVPASMGGEPFASAVLSLGSTLPARLLMTKNHAQVVGMLGRHFSNGALELELDRLHAHLEKISSKSPQHGKRRRS